LRLPAAAALLVPAAPFVVAAAVGNSHTAAPQRASGPPVTSAATPGAAPAGGEIDYVDVGQGDGVAMRIGGRYILSDAGQHNVDAVEHALERLGATNKTIDVAILSHPHSDHVKNFLALLDDGWTIKTAVLSHSEWWGGTNTNMSLIDALTAHGATLQYVVAGNHFDWGGADWEILNPPEGKYTGVGQAPDSSVAYVLTVDGDKFVFTGDIGKSVAKAVAERWTSEQLGAAKVFLATHHGSASGSTDQLLQAIQPTYAVLSTGPNAYGHPSPSAAMRLEKHGVTIWCTDTNGTVRATISSGGKITWDRSKQQAAWWSATNKEAGKGTGNCVGKEAPPLP
jgi:competence protein ComEC